MHGSRWRGLETEQTWPRTLGWHNRPGNRRPRRPQALKPASHRASPRPYIGGWWLALTDRWPAFRTRILVLGYDDCPAGGPGGRGFHQPRLSPSLLAGTGLCCSGGLRDGLDTLP